MSDQDPDPDETQPEERVRRIEQETEQLAQEIDEAREAVDRARRAGTMAAPGEKWPEPVGTPGETDADEAGKPVDAE